MMTPKAEQLRVQLEGLESSLVVAPSRGASRPLAKKRLDGSDRLGGYPPA